MAPLRLVVTMIVLLFMSALALAKCESHGQNKGNWVDIWASMPQLTEPANLPPEPFNDTGVVFHNSTIRQTIRVTLPAQTLRLEISNAFGGSDLPITSASIAMALNGSAGTSAIDSSTIQPLTFSGGHTNYTIPRGALAVSDPMFDFPVTTGLIVAISLTTNLNDRWPDVLSTRLQPQLSTSSISVLNLAAGGIQVLYDGLGPNALSRVDRDVLSANGVKYVLVFEGVNDIGTAAVDPASQQNVGTRLIAAYGQMITWVHAKGIPIFGATIMPFSGPGQTYSDPERERTRHRVNTWIRE
ncbi:extracellular gdsl-like lipase [Seiridium cupressi]